MKIYIKQPSHSAHTIVYQINETINKLNLLTDLAVEYNRCVEENKKRKNETLPIYKDQETRYSQLLSKLEQKQNRIENELSQLSAVHIVEKKRLQHDLSIVKSDIAINYNNYSRARHSVSEIIKKMDLNSAFIETNPLDETTEQHHNLIIAELNPAINLLSKTINTPLFEHNPNIINYIERYEIANEESFELD